MGKYYRNGRDLGLEGTIAWLEQWYDEPLDLEVQGIDIVCPNTMNKAHFQEAKVGRQSELHAFLKYAARCWLETQQGVVVSYERRLYSPHDDVPVDYKTEELMPDGSRFHRKVGLPHILAKGDRFPCYFGTLLEVDVLCEGQRNISVEVGATSPFNLLVPLLDGLVRKAVWIPFPQLNDQRFPSVVRGYAVTDPLDQM